MRIAMIRITIQATEAIFCTITTITLLVSNHFFLLGLAQPSFCPMFLLWLLWWNCRRPCFVPNKIIDPGTAAIVWINEPLGFWNLSFIRLKRCRVEIALTNSKITVSGKLLNGSLQWKWVSFKTLWFCYYQLDKFASKRTNVDCPSIHSLLTSALRMVEDGLNRLFWPVKKYWEFELQNANPAFSYSSLWLLVQKDLSGESVILHEDEESMNGLVSNPHKLYESQKKLRFIKDIAR